MKVTKATTVTIELSEFEAKRLNAALERTYAGEAAHTLLDLSVHLDAEELYADETTFDEVEEG